MFLVASCCRLTLQSYLQRHTLCKASGCDLDRPGSSAVLVWDVTLTGTLCCFHSYLQRQRNCCSNNLILGDKQEGTFSFCKRLCWTGFLFLTCMSKGFPVVMLLNVMLRPAGTLLVSRVRSVVGWSLGIEIDRGKDWLTPGLKWMASSWGCRKMVLASAMSVLQKFRITRNNIVRFFFLTS